MAVICVAERPYFWIGMSCKDTFMCRSSMTKKYTAFQNAKI